MRTLFFTKILFLISLTGIFSNSMMAQNTEAAMDQIIESAYKPGEPGATVLVAKNGEVIYRKAFGMANLELGVPMKPEMVFEIGSITKQFTAVSILMLMEQGKLSLNDDITKFIPDYPTQGHNITIHHLLTHTSGIKSYTGMQEWQPLWRKDMSPAEMIDVFKNQPMDFAPGEKFLYNNSAYFLLGYIIEKASGLTYEQFLEDNIFKPLEMNNSYYGSHKKIIPNRAAGYQNQDGFTNAEYLSLTQPYSAGSIMSNVDDMLKWQNAVRDNKLVMASTIQLAFKGYSTNENKPFHYGYGWGLNEINGSPTLEHGGGIFGYTTNGIWLPREDVYVIMLTNRDDLAPEGISTRLAAVAIGKPFPVIADGVELKPETAAALSGWYAFEDGSFRNIIYEDGVLYSQRKGSSRFRLIPLSESRFAFENSLSMLEFAKNENGIHSVVFKNRINEIRGGKTDKIPEEKKEITLSPEQMQPYTGEYEIQPGFSLVVTLENGRLMTQATGQAKFEIYPESEVKFFLKVVDAQIEFQRNKDGEVDSLILFQNGAEIRAIKK
ncbi:serine hydrolase [Lentimicrobium sp.]|uniref:serine hydrolase n=1 Tax=Lentimicrobium sp. TaxID=2034841 RepID=UPI002BE636D4|nr:serine hydrolase [Lentimicrobium sp.]HPF65070.1 serine hydrolase [Lentimicrobium sp.]